jgi:hypothetical protein
LTPGQQPTSDGFAADKWLTHRRSVACCTATVTSLDDREASFTIGRERETNFTLGEKPDR